MSNERVSKPRLEWADVAKGLAILLVTLYHADVVLGKVSVDTGVSGDFHRFLQPLRMPLFFAISGLFASSVLKASYVDLWNRRLSQYIWLLVLWTSIMWLIGKHELFEGDPAYPRNIMALAKDIVRPLGYIWFLWCLPIYFLAARILTGLDRRLLLFALTIVSIFGFWVDELNARNGVLSLINRNIALLSAPKYFVFFWGASAYRDKLVSYIPERPKQYAAALLVFSVCSALAVYLDEPVFRAVLSMPASCSGVLLLLSFANGILRIAPSGAKYLRALGTRTVPLYVIQMPFMMSLVMPFEGSIRASPMVAIFLHMLLAAMTVVTARFLAQSAEKLDCTWLFNAPSALQIRTKKRAGATAN